ncbi:hypothetical protein BH09PAT3_BH09PAT3_4550 [soil metagenome]
MFENGFEKRLPFPLNRGFRLIGALGGYAAYHLGHTKSLDNNVEVQRDTVLADIDAKILDFSLRRSPQVVEAHPDAAELEAAEQAALPELKALRDFVDTQGCQSQQDIDGVDLSAEPQEFPSKLLEHFMEQELE